MAVVGPLPGRGGQRLAGRQVIRYRATLDRFPVFGREGYALPLGPVVQHTGEIDKSKPLDALWLFGTPSQALEGFAQAKIALGEGRVQVLAALASTGASAIAAKRGATAAYFPISLCARSIWSGSNARLAFKVLKFFRITSGSSRALRSSKTSLYSPLRSRTTGALTVNFSVGGTANFGVSPNDYTQTGAATFTASSGTVTFGAGAPVKDDAQTRQHREHDRGGSIMNVGNDVWRLIAATGKKGYPEPGHRGDLAQYHFSGAISVVGKQERTDCEQEPDKEIAGPTALVIRGADRSN